MPERPAVDARFEALLLDFLAYLEFERGLSRNTLAAYRTDLLQYGTFLAARGHRRRPRRPAPTSPTSSPTSRRGRRTGRPCGPATLNRKTACLRSFYRHLRRAELIDGDPTATIKPPRKGRPLPKVLGYAEVKRLLESVYGSEPADLRDRAILEVMYGCGLRASETIGLEIGSVDLRRGFLRAHGKGSKERIVPLGREADDGGQALPALRPRRDGRRRRRAGALPQPARRRADPAGPLQGDPGPRPRRSGSTTG